jgi:hypothetical protein
MARTKTNVQKKIRVVSDERFYTMYFRSLLHDRINYRQTYITYFSDEDFISLFYMSEEYFYKNLVLFVFDVNKPKTYSLKQVEVCHANYLMGNIL